MDNTESKKKKKKLTKKQKKFIAVTVGLLLVIIATAVTTALLIKKSEKKNENKKQILTSTTIEKIVKIKELSTFRTVFNGVAVVMNEKKPENLDFYVSYEAVVKSGFDFDKMKINIDHEEKTVILIIPAIRTTDVAVDISSLDFIFINKKANTSTVSSRAYEACVNDVKDKSSRESQINELAKQSAENIIKALVNPFIEQAYPDYKLIIR